MSPMQNDTSREKDSEVIHSSDDMDLLIQAGAKRQGRYAYGSNSSFSPRVNSTLRGYLNVL